MANLRYAGSGLQDDRICQPDAHPDCFSTHMVLIQVLFTYWRPKL
jgi:hypothetical protein